MLEEYIYQISLEPISKTEYISAQEITEKNFAEFMKSTPFCRYFLCPDNIYIGEVSRHKRLEKIRELKEHDGVEVGRDGKGMYIVITSRKEYYRSAWEKHCKEMHDNCTLETFMEVYGEENPFCRYVYADGEIMPFTAFVNRCAVSEKYYLGNCVRYYT